MGRVIYDFAEALETKQRLDDDSARIRKQVHDAVTAERLRLAPKSAANAGSAIGGARAPAAGASSRWRPR